jgi:hypothetical protein
MASLAPTRIIKPLQTNRIHAKPRIRTIMKNTNNLKLGPAFLPGYHRQLRRELVVRGVRVRHGGERDRHDFRVRARQPKLDTGHNRQRAREVEEFPRIGEPCGRLVRAAAAYVDGL